MYSPSYETTPSWAGVTKWYTLLFGEAPYGINLTDKSLRSLVEGHFKGDGKKYVSGWKAVRTSYRTSPLYTIDEQFVEKVDQIDTLIEMFTPEQDDKSKEKIEAAQKKKALSRRKAAWAREYYRSKRTKAAL